MVKINSTFTLVSEGHYYSNVNLPLDAFRGYTGTTLLKTTYLGGKMGEALIIDTCRTPRGIGKAGKGALSHLHPQHLGSTVLSALADRTGIDTSEVDDVIWGTSSQVCEQGGDLGRMSALDAGYDIKASGVTLDRFCGSGITSANIAASSVMSGMEDLVVSGGTEMMSLPKKGVLPMGANNPHLQEIHPQSHQGVVLMPSPH